MIIHITTQTILLCTYVAGGKFHWAKLLQISRFFRGPWKFFHEYFALTLSIKNKCPGLVPRKYYCENPYNVDTTKV